MTLLVSLLNVKLGYLEKNSKNYENTVKTVFFIYNEFVKIKLKPEKSGIIKLRK